MIRIFPKIQFIMTTHSPSILVNVPKENIWVLDNFQLYHPQSNTYGRTVEEVLQEVMDINVQPDHQEPYVGILRGYIDKKLKLK